MYRTIGILVTVVTVLCGLAGCASTQKYEAALNQWVGKSEAALVKAWGNPQSERTEGDTRLLTYQVTSWETIPGEVPTYRVDAIGHTPSAISLGGVVPEAYRLDCKTTFSIQKGVIQSWQYEGNDCVSR